MTDASATGYAGQLGLTGSNNEHNAMTFLVQQMLARTRTMTIVRVEAVSNEGELAPVGTVDVTPLVNLVDGLGNPTEHSTIYGIPYTRLQGGANAIILDPVVGDIGWMAVSDRDISPVKETKDRANPGSWRRFDLADGVYIGGILNGQPTQYVRFSSDGLELVSPTKVRVQAPVFEVDAPIATFSGDVTVDGGAVIGESAVVGGDLTVLGGASIMGALSAASLAISGAIAAASAAISGALEALTLRATSSGASAITSPGTIKNDDGTTLGAHTHEYLGPAAPPVAVGVTSVPSNT